MVKKYLNFIKEDILITEKTHEKRHTIFTILEKMHINAIIRHYTPNIMVEK